MTYEIERKYLLKEIPSLDGVPFFNIKQGYLLSNENGLVRIRTLEGNNQDAGYLTVKGSGLIKRFEKEIEIPFELASSFLKNIENIIEKKRFCIVHENKKIEIDIFEGKLGGLVLAEIELESEDENISLPNWIGQEVTYSPEYQNINLIGKISQK